MTIESMSGSVIDIEEEINTVLETSDPFGQIFSFWYNEQISIGMLSVEEPDLKMEIEVVLIEQTPDDIETRGDIDAPGLDDVIDKLSTETESATGEKPEFELLGAGNNGSGAYSAVLESEIDFDDAG